MNRGLKLKSQRRSKLPRSKGKETLRIRTVKLNNPVKAVKFRILKRVKELKLNNLMSNRKDSSQLLFKFHLRLKLPKSKKGKVSPNRPNR